jgi:hypothetical protein
MICKIPLPPQNLVVPSFFAEIRKVWTDPAKNTNKIKYVERVEIDVSLVRLELNPMSTLPEFKTLMVSTY